MIRESRMNNDLSKSKTGGSVLKGFYSLPIRIKLLVIMMISVIMIMVVNFVMYFNINRITRRLDRIYSGNVQLSELEQDLDALQNAFTSYMTTRSTDTLQNYYEKEQQFSDHTQQLSSSVTDNSLQVMERNIKNLSESYLSITGRTIDARRGRNVEKYSAYYEDAQRVYGYLSAYIQGLNKKRFMINTESYETLSISLTYLERMNITVFILVALFDVLFVLLMTRSMTDPLMQLSAVADRVTEGHLDEAGVVPVYAMDEIGIVTKAFNQMVSSIPGYLERLRESMEKQQALVEKELLMETHLKDARLKYLQAQINPHFLFNTLNAGSQLAMMEGADRTQAYVLKVADFFRYNIGHQKEDVTLSDEIKMVDTYIYILNVRFSGDIHFEKNIEDERLLSVMVPGMILQPIVENSVKYGISQMEGNGLITLSVKRASDNIQVSISDNGEGMDQEIIDRVLSGEHMQDPTQERKPGEDAENGGNGIGLYNVMQRLLIYFDHKSSFEIISEGKGKGSTVVISLPYTDI